MSTMDDLFSRAKHLSASQRLALAHRLLTSDEPQVADDIDAAWDREIRRRIVDFDAGRTTTRPADAVFDDLDQRFAK